MVMRQTEKTKEEAEGEDEEEVEEGVGKSCGTETFTLVPNNLLT